MRLRREGVSRVGLAPVPRRNPGEAPDEEGDAERDEQSAGDDEEHRGFSIGRGDHVLEPSAKGVEMRRKPCKGGANATARRGVGGAVSQDAS